MAANESRCREAVAVNGETRLGTTQNQGVATLTVGAKADHRGPMFHNLEPVQIECANVNFPTMGIHG